MKRAGRSPVSDAARSCIDLLEGRVLLSTTTTISHPDGFSDAFDIAENGSATLTTAGELQLIPAAGTGEAGSVWDVAPQGISTFDTTFKFDWGPHTPDADGFTFVIQNDARGIQATGGAGGNMGYGGITPSVAVKFDLYDGAPQNSVGGPKTGNTIYTASGVYTNGETPADDPRQGVTTTPAPLHTSVDFSQSVSGTTATATGLDFHANAADNYQVHLVYDGTTLTETLSDLTQSISATQTYTVNIPGIIGGNMANVGFTAGDGGAFSTPQIATWVYTGVAASSAIPLPPPALTGASGLAGAAELSWTESAPAALPVTGYEVDQVNGTTATKIATLGNVNNYEVTGLNPTQSYTFEVKALGDNTTSANSAFSNQVTVNAAGQAPTLRAFSPLPGQVAVSWTTPFTPTNGLELDASTDNGATFSKLATFGPANGSYTFTNLDPTKTYQLKLSALGNGTTTNNSPASNVVSASPVGTQPGAIDYSSGFPASAAVQLNGGATLTGATGTPPNALEITDGNTGEARSAFVTTPEGVDTFDTTFDFTYGTSVAPAADGFTFTVQNDPRGVAVIGGGGGDLGYTGITNSVAVIFNLYNNVSQTGIALGGAQAKGNPVDLTTLNGSPTGVDFHAHPGDTFQAHLVYDGTTLTETVTDQTQTAAGNTATFTTTYTVDIPGTVGGGSAYVGFTGATGGAAAKQDVTSWTYTGTGATQQTLPNPVAVVNSSAPGVVDVGWNDPLAAAGYEVDQSTDGTNFTPVATNLPPSATFHEITGLTPGSTYTFHVKTTAIGDAPARTSNDVQITVPTTASAPIDYSAGFISGQTNLSFNGANGVQPTLTATNQLQLTNGGNQSTSAFAITPQNVNGFTTAFEFTYGPGASPPGDGFAFVIQNSPAGATAIGGGGGALGYAGADLTPGSNVGGIPNSVAIKFDLYSNVGEGTDSTGLFINGDAPSLPLRTDQEASVDMTPSGVQLGTTGDTYKAQLSYDGSTLHEVVTDETTGKSFSHDYAVNLPQILGGNTAYVGFTAGTGGAEIEQDINNWSFQHVAVSSQTVTGTSGNDTITIKKDATDATKDDVWVNAPTTGAPTTQVSNSQPIVINGGGGTDTLVIDSSAGQPIPTGATGLVLNQLTGGSFTLGGSLPTLDATHTVDVTNSTVNIPYTGTSILPAVQSELKNGSIFSSTAAGTSGKFAIADVDDGSQVSLSYRVVGDINGDSTVGFSDLLTLAQNYNKTGQDWGKGDLTYDGTVGFADLLALAQHYNQTAAAAPAAAAATPLAAQASDDLLPKKRKH